MRWAFCVLAALVITSTVSAQRPLRHVLFDLEEGVEGWWCNVYGGAGAGEPSRAAEAHYGSGALHGEVADVEGGANIISPWLSEDADWRRYEWGSISLWFRGDGTPNYARLIIAVGSEDEGDQQTYSINLPLDSTKWRRISRPLASFWNRHKVPMDTQRIGRLYISAKGTHSFDVDHITLEAPQRPVALQSVSGAGGLPVEPVLVQFPDARHALRFDPTPLMPGPITVTARFELPNGVHEVTQGLPRERPEDEVFLVAPACRQSGTATVELTITRAGRTDRTSWRFNVVTERPLPEPTPLSLLPAPKEIELLQGAFALLPASSPVCSADAVHSPALRLLIETLVSWGVRGEDVRGVPRDPDQPMTIRLGAPPPLASELAGRLGELPEQGYVLAASAKGVQIAANDAAGLRNGVCTLLQAAESHYALTGELAVPAMKVVDWPSLPVRAVSLPLPNNRWGHPNDPPADPDMFLDFMREVVVNSKMNMAVLIIHQAMRYESHPKVTGPAAWSKADVKRVFDTLRSWGVEPVPHMNSLGHANWLTIPYRDLAIAEDGDLHQFCTSNPNTKRIMLDIYQEIIDLVQPRYFHVGLDEIRWKTYALPEEQRCPLCAGKSKQDIFVEWVQMLHDFLADQGIEMMMWGDMILPGHNGGPPYRLAETVDRLPKNIIIANWSTAVMPDSHQWLLDHGFTRIIKSNSRGANLAEQQVLMGNMMGVWYKTPWLTEQTLPKLEGNAYGSILEAAEYSWNYWPDLFTVMPPLSVEFFAQRPLVQWRVGADPVPGASPPESLDLPGAGPVEGLPETLDGTPLTALALSVGAEATVPVNQEVRSLYFVHAARLLDREAMVEAFKDPSAWAGVPIAEYVVTYASGDTVTIPVRYGMEVRDPKTGWCIVPLVYDCMQVVPMTCAEGLHLYTMQWRNPRPDDAVVSVTLRALDAPAQVVLAGLRAQ